MERRADSILRNADVNAVKGYSIVLAYLVFS